MCAAAQHDARSPDQYCGPHPACHKSLPARALLKNIHRKILKTRVRHKPRSQYLTSAVRQPKNQTLTTPADLSDCRRSTSKMPALSVCHNQKWSLDHRTRSGNSLSTLLKILTIFLARLWCARCTIVSTVLRCIACTMKISNASIEEFRDVGQSVVFHSRHVEAYSWAFHPKDFTL